MFSHDLHTSDQALTRIARLHVTFVDRDGAEHKFEVADGDNLLDIAQANDLEMEGPLYASMTVWPDLHTDNIFRSMWWFMCLLDMSYHRVFRRLLQQDGRTG